MAGGGRKLAELAIEVPQPATPERSDGGRGFLAGALVI